MYSKYVVNLTLTPILIAVLVSCTQVDNRRMSTHAKILNVRDALDSCNSKATTLEDIILCVEQYAVRLGIPKENSRYFLVDSYGEQLVLVPSKGCEMKAMTFPYSRGPNRIDECGSGDDVR